MADNQIAEFIEILIQSKKIFVITGSGISAESGIPTFRGKEGWWKNNDPMKLASPEGFRENPELVWEWYNYRKKLVKESYPNPGHYILSEMEKHYPDFLLATQNVDRLHHRAGSGKIIEIHGNILNSRCTICFRHYTDEEKPTENINLSKCDCGGLLRPNVVWYGEYISQNDLMEISDYLSNPPKMDLLIMIGTSSLLPYIQYWAMDCIRKGIPLVEINLDESPVSSIAHLRFHEKSGEFLPRIWGEVKKHSDKRHIHEEKKEMV